MFIAVDDGFVINLKDFDTMGLSSKKKKVKHLVSSGFLGLFPEYKEKEEIVSWSLTIDYTNQEGKKTQYAVECPDRGVLVKSARSVFKQIQQYDPSMINSAFEEAFFKDK